LGSILDFNTGISRVMRDIPAVAPGLPERRQIAPTAITGVQQLERLTSADNLDAVIAQALQPAVDSRDILHPDRFEAALDRAAAAIDRALATLDAAPLGAGGKAGLQGLAAVLREHRELQDAFRYSCDMLIGG
jgi:hypothetical protein